MSDNPTTGKWTAQTIAKCYDIDSITATRLAFDINAALAAERGNVSMESSRELIMERDELREQLDSEREKPKTTQYAQGWDDHVLAARSQIEDLKEQLAAAVEALKVLREHLLIGDTRGRGIIDAALAKIGEKK